MTTPIAPVAIADPLELLPDPSDLDTWPVRMAEMHRWMREDASPGMQLLGTSAYANATAALEAATTALAAANFVGAWSGLTGALALGSVVSHGGKLWLLLVNLADVTASQPTTANTDWMDLLSASSHAYSNGVSGMAASTVQAAIDELAGAQNNDNYLINGEMTSVSRGASFAAVVDGQPTIDLWKVGKSNAAALTVSQVQSWDHPIVQIDSRGFIDAMRIEVTTADATISAGDVQLIYQNIVGRRARSLVSDLRGFTIGFWYRSNKAGVHCVAFRNGGFLLSYVAEFTVAVSGVWAFYSITVPAPVPSGSSFGSGWNFQDGVGLSVSFTLANGTTRQTTAGSWQAGSFLSTSSQVNVLDTIGNYIEVTGVRLYRGLTAKAYAYEDQAVTRAKVREWVRVGEKLFVAGVTASGASTGIGVPLMPPMAATPSVGSVTDSSAGAVGARTASATASYFQVTAAGTSSAGYIISYQATLSCEL
ncbi:hypothetical protein KIH07_16770 [Hydrogenophaga taeniospiralis]|uniref:hypothetical protein n=1 Tax=Hydrogenophaga taeniospiralis TaxID=65656 RepID=UPI001CF992FB|nr:hypothetical protein [Hydrogenophaga taeniospiralis]MCB4365398.1 hypothetical protein [Hydrogenophaga taeniospiralis]